MEKFKVQMSASQKIYVGPLRYIKNIYLNVVSGSPTIKIGTTSGGEELMDSTALSLYSIVVPKLQYFVEKTTLYVTLSGGGKVSIEINTKMV
jgi:hypothetical protein